MMSENNTSGQAPTLGLTAEEVDGTERLSADDMATQREAQFLAAAMRAQQARHAAEQSQPGRCRYCRERCLPAAVFCDEACRGDWEREQQVLRRQGRAR